MVSDNICRERVRLRTMVDQIVEVRHRSVVHQQNGIHGVINAYLC
jgi:hypothetical protein